MKSWLFGGPSIPARHALFDLDDFTGHTVADLFGEDHYFVDADQFWLAQNAAIEARRAEYLDKGWPDVIVVAPEAHFHVWEYEKAPKRKGGRVYIDVRASGEVIFHEGYVSRCEARRIAKGEAPCAGPPQPRPEITGSMQTYIDLHRHAAVRAALIHHPAVALRVMVAHAIAGSQLWNLRPDPQTTRSEAVRESVEACRGEADFDERRRAVLNLLGFSPEEPTVTGGDGGDHGLSAVFLRLLDLPDTCVMDVIAVVMGETLSAGGVAVEAVGLHIGVDMAQYWEADKAFFDLIRDRQVLGCLVEDVAGDVVASANRDEKTALLKRIVRDCLDGAEGRARTENWVPRWMRFPPSAYTKRGGVGTVSAYAEVETARACHSNGPDPHTPPNAAFRAAPIPVAA